MPSTCKKYTFSTEKELFEWLEQGKEERVRIPVYHVPDRIGLGMGQLFLGRTPHIALRIDDTRSGMGLSSQLSTTETCWWMEGVWREESLLPTTSNHFSFRMILGFYEETVLMAERFD
jgi:hypothetical protein